jgi:hypothetical protein
MRVLFVTAAALRAASAVTAAHPWTARASFTSARTASVVLPVAGGGAGEDDDADAEGDGDAEEDDDGDADGDGDDDEPEAGEELDDRAEPVPAGAVEPGRVRCPGGGSVAAVVPLPVAPATVPAGLPAAACVERVAGTCRGVAMPVSGRPSTPSTTGVVPSAEFDEELSSDTGAPTAPETTGTARATTPTPIPTSSTGSHRCGCRGRNHRSAAARAARMRADGGGPAGVWFTRSAPKLSKRQPLLWRD